MKRKNEEVPGFDEIIFENRNKEYGAYDLRKHYYSTTSISILGGIAFSAMLVTALSFSTEKGTASTGGGSVIITMAPVITPDPVKPTVKPPAELAGAIKNLAPEVTTDSSVNLTALLPTDQLVETTVNGNPEGTVDYVVPTDPVTPPENEVFLVVEEMPEFPGGTDELLKFIGENLSYPREAIINNVQGRVILKFVVNTDGSIDRIEVLSGIDASLNNEAVRVIKTLPKFRPGKQGGVPVPVWFCLPVLFRLQNN